MQQVTVAGHNTLRKVDYRIIVHAEPVTLFYTSGEWRAFVNGVKTGEFDDLVAGKTSDLVPIRDSKDPDGPMLAFTVEHMRSLFSAIRSGKYDFINGVQ